MKKKKIENALKSDTPMNSLYALIPPNRVKAFNKLAKLFGKTEQDIKNVLENEKR